MRPPDPRRATAPARETGAESESVLQGLAATPDLIPAESVGADSWTVSVLRAIARAAA